MNRSISWRNLRGTKTYHTLEPKMLIGAVRKALATRPVPYSQYKFDNYSVRFDRDYAVQKVRRDLTTPLAGCDLKDIKDGVGRSDLLIHRDANVPGSMGCIVLPDEEWRDFVRVFTAKTQGGDRLPLTVIYT